MSDEQYKPSTSVDENLNQIQSKDKADAAKAKNDISKAKNIAQKGVKSGMLNLNGVAKGSFTADNSESESESQTSETASVKLPDGVTSEVDACAKAVAQGKHPKMLAWDSVNLSDTDRLHAYDCGLIDVDDAQCKEIMQNRAKFAGEEQPEEKTDTQKSVAKTGKTLAPLEQDDTKDFLSSAYDMSDAMAHASDYIVTDDSQLNQIYEDSDIAKQSQSSEEQQSDTKISETQFKRMSQASELEASLDYGDSDEAQMNV